MIHQGEVVADGEGYEFNGANHVYCLNIDSFRLHRIQDISCDATASSHWWEQYSIELISLAEVCTLSSGRSS